MLYYKDETTRITSSEVMIGEHNYPLDHIDYIWRTKTGKFTRGIYVLITRIGIALITVGILLSAVIALITTDFGPHRHTVIMTAIFISIVLGIIAGFGIDPLLELLDRSHETGHGIHEMWAMRRGEVVLLLQTTDELRFGKIYRSLRRAIEHRT